MLRGPLAMRFIRTTCGAHSTCARTQCTPLTKLGLLNALLLNLVYCYTRINYLYVLHRSLVVNICTSASARLQPLKHIYSTRSRSFIAEKAAPGLARGTRKIEGFLPQTDMELDRDGIGDSSPHPFHLKVETLECL